MAVSGLPVKGNMPFVDVDVVFAIYSDLICSAILLIFFYSFFFPAPPKWSPSRFLINLPGFPSCKPFEGVEGFSCLLSLREPVLADVFVIVDFFTLIIDFICQKSFHFVVLKYVMDSIKLKSLY